MVVLIPIDGYYYTSEIPLMGHPDTLTELLQIALTKVIDEKYNGLRHDLKLAIGGDANNNITIAIFGNLQYHESWYNGEQVNKAAVKRFYNDLTDGLKQALFEQGNLSHPDANLENLVTKFFLRKQSGDLHGVQHRAKKAAFGDQAHAIGYATAETNEAMPLEFVLSRKIAWNLEQAVKAGLITGGYDGKVIVTVEKDDAKIYGVRQVIVAKQHEKSQPLKELTKIVKEQIIPSSLGKYLNKNIEMQVNNGSEFNEGGILADMGVPCDFPFYTGYWTGADAPTGEDRTKADGPLMFYSRAIAKTLIEILKPYGCRTVKVDVSTSMGSEEIKSLSIEIRDENNKIMYTKKQREQITKEVLSVFNPHADSIMANYWCMPDDLKLLIEKGAVFGYNTTQLKSIFGNQGYKRITWEHVKPQVELLKPKIEKYIRK